MYVSKLVTASFKLMISAFSHHDRVGLLTHVEEVAETYLTNQVQLCLFRIAQGFWAYCSFLCINGLYITCYLSAYTKANAIGLCRHRMQNYIISSKITNKSKRNYYNEPVFLTFANRPSHRLYGSVVSSYLYCEDSLLASRGGDGDSGCACLHVVRHHNQLGTAIERRECETAWRR